MKQTRILWMAAALCLGLFGAQALAGNVQLGVYLQDLNNNLRKSFGYDGQGVLISGIVPGTSAEEAGLSKGDIIVSFDGEKIASSSQLGDIIRKAEPGQKVEITVFSDGAMKTLDAVLKAPAQGKVEKKRKAVVKEEKEESEEEEGREGEEGEHGWSWITPDHLKQMPDINKWIVTEDNRAFMGISYLDLTPQLAKYFGVEYGVLVSEVEDGSPADKAGLKAGDVLVAWNGKALERSTGMLDRLRDADEGDQVELTVVRKSEKMEMEITLGERKNGVSQFFYGNPSNPNSLRDFILKVPEKGKPLAVPSPPRSAVVPFPDMSELQETLKNLQKEMKEQQKQMEKLRKELKGLKKEETR